MLDAALGAEVGTELGGMWLRGDLLTGAVPRRLLRPTPAGILVYGMLPRSTLRISGCVLPFCNWVGRMRGV